MTTNNPVTIATAFFDINRAEKGDGRTIDEYKCWIKQTLQLNCNLFVITEEKFKDFFMENRPKEYNMFIKIIDFKDLHYYKYYDRMKEITESNYFKQKVAHPNRVECVLPEYNIIQYSKFHYISMAIEENPFKSDFFFWMDAGASRFFYDIDIHKPFPSEKGIQIIKNNSNFFIAQNRFDLDAIQHTIDDNFVWKSDNLIYGGMFGGNPNIIQLISQKVENVFLEKMLNNNNMNNEQLALAIVWKENKNLFGLCSNIRSPMILLHILSMV